MNLFELSVLDKIQELFACPFMDKAMPIVSDFGEKGIFFIVIAIIFMIFKKTRKTGLSMGLALIMGLIIGNYILKILVARERPFMLNPEFNLIVERLKDYSFPSGHAIACFECATVLMIRDKRFGIPALVLAVLVGFSRMYLYMHFPTDVLGGALIGVGVGFLSCFIVDKIYNKFENKKEKTVV